MAVALRNLREPRGFGWWVLGLGLLPPGFGIAALASDLFLHTRWFGANPVRTAEHFFGFWTLRLLLLTLAVTPLRQLTGWTWLVRQRRTLGLLAFSCLMAHWLVYALLDVQLAWHDLMKDLTKRPYIMVGMAALLGMLPLAITSTSAMMRRLGRRWTQLHKLSYAIAVAGVVHFWMAVKKDITEPALYAAVLAVLLGMRLVSWWRRSRARAARAQSPA